MKILFKEIYEIYISNILISNNYFVNLCILGVIGYAAYKMSFYIVGKLGFRNNVGSFFHWSIRGFIFVIKVYNFIRALSILNKCFIFGFIIFILLVFVKIRKIVAPELNK